MFRSLILLPLLCLAPTTPAVDAPGSAAPEVAKGFHQIKLNGHTFTLPEGFTIELAAAPPLADRPIVAALDEKGHLYVCDSSGSNDRVTEQVKTKPHRILRLEDTDGDGKYDKSTVYVANVMFPEGAMWLNGSLYVAAPPHIWKFTDTDGDGKADKEEIWFDGKTLTGCANDLHGPYLGPDGWIYWCKGAFAEQKYTVNGKPFVTKASHIFRARPDGSGLEPVMTGGMDNPVDVVFTPSGERIFSCTFLQHPANGKRDGLIHAVYGGVYGKDHAPVYDHPWTSPKLMEPMTHLGPAAPCGLHRYESDQFGKDYENNLFCCQFNLRKVSRHILVPSGSTYVTKDSDFVVSDQHDFHPTDVIEDAEGSLLILDTGGWYKLCCPSSQLVKPDVKGAIYRVKKVGAHKERLKRKPAPPLSSLYTIALDRDVSGIDFAISSLKDPDLHTRRVAADALGRIRNTRAVPYLIEALADVRNDATLDHSLTFALIQLEDRDSLKKKLPDTTSKVRRALLAALDQIPAASKADSDTIFDFFAKGEKTIDMSIQDENRRSFIRSHFAKMGMPRPADNEKYTKEQFAIAHSKGLAALGSLDPKHVLAELDSHDAALRETAWWIAGRHPQWGDQLASYFADQLKRADKLRPADRDVLADHLAKFAKSETVQKVLGNSLPDAPPESSRVILRAMARSGLKMLPEIWEKGIAKSLVSSGEGVQRDALTTIQNVQSSRDFSKLLLDMKNWPPPKGEMGWTFGFHLQVQATAPPGTFTLDAKTTPEFATWLDRNHPPEVRAAASEVIARSTITSDGLRGLAPALKTAHPLDLPKLLSVYSKSTDEKVGLAFVEALSHPKVLPSVRIEVVKPILDKYPATVQAEAEKLYAMLAEARKGETAKLERLLKELPAGDIRRGQAIFNGAKAQCAACHKIGYVGGLVGPDLTKIGSIRTERDLLEAIVFPSASFVRSYEPVRVTTLDGRVLSGILKKDAPDEIVLTVAADKEERLARADVESIAPGTVSVMPDGFDKQVTPQELADLVAFLKACK